jgi:uncharacterized spore protein YtfJ
MDYDRMFAQFDNLPEHATVNAVYGEPVEVEDKVIIPVASVSYAFGLGLGEGQGSSEEEGGESGSGAGAGGGGGVQAKPVAIIEITPERTHVEGIVDEQLIALAGIAFAAWAVFWVASALIRIFGRRK